MRIRSGRDSRRRPAAEQSMTKNGNKVPLRLRAECDGGAVLQVAIAARVIGIGEQESPRHGGQRTACSPKRRGSGRRRICTRFAPWNSAPTIPVTIQSPTKERSRDPAAGLAVRHWGGR